MDDLPRAGLDRRALLRRSAAVGGTLVWAVPVVQSLGGVAYAASSDPAGTHHRKARLLFTVPVTDEPVFTVHNDSEGGVALVSFSLTIGNERYSYERILRESQGGPVASRLTPDPRRPEERADVVAYAFAGFVPGQSFTFRARVSPDPATSGQAPERDPRHVLFHNGRTTANSVATFGFSEGAPLSLTFASKRAGSGHVFAVSD